MHPQQLRVSHLSFGFADFKKILIEFSPDRVRNRSLPRLTTNIFLIANRFSIRLPLSGYPLNERIAMFKIILVLLSPIFTVVAMTATPAFAAGNSASSNRPPSRLQAHGRRRQAGTKAVQQQQTVHQWDVLRFVPRQSRRLLGQLRQTLSACRRHGQRST